jgi:hypothetical protein
MFNFSVTEIKTEDLSPEGQRSLNDVSDKWPHVKAELETKLKDVLKKIETFHTDRQGQCNDWVRDYELPFARAEHEWKLDLYTQKEAVLEKTFPAITPPDRYPFKIDETFSDQCHLGLAEFHVTYNVSDQNNSERKYKVQWKLSLLWHAKRVKT